MGGSDQLTLPADKTANSIFGGTVDSNLIHDPMLRFMAATQGVTSRNGPISVQLPATVQTTGDEMTVEFNHNGIGARKIKNSHRKDPLTNRLVGICGFDGQFESDLARLNGSKKAWIGSNHQQIDNPLVKVEIQSNSFHISKGLAKIAYLANCRILGDEFALSSFGEAYRRAIKANNWDEFDNCGLHLFWAMDLTTVFLPKIYPHQHMLATFCAGGFNLTTVLLFGGAAAFTFGFPPTVFGFSNLYGRVIINNIKNRTIIEKELREITSIPEMVRRMGLYLEKHA
jgi:hypothetical protein